MSEDIKKNVEIAEEELDNVSGGVNLASASACASKLFDASAVAVKEKAVASKVAAVNASAVANKEIVEKRF